MEIREMTDKQKLAYIQGRIAVRIGVVEIRIGNVVADALWSEIEKLITWLDGLIEDDELVVIDGPGEHIPDITFESIVNAQTNEPVKFSDLAHTADPSVRAMRDCHRRSSLRSPSAKSKSAPADNTDKSKGGLQSAPTGKKSTKTVNPNLKKTPAKTKNQGWSGKVKSISKASVLKLIELDDYEDIPALTAAILDKCNCTNTALQKLLDLDSSAISTIINKKKVYPYVKEAFREFFQFPRKKPIPSKTLDPHEEAIEPGLQAEKKNSALDNITKRFNIKKGA